MAASRQLRAAAQFNQLWVACDPKHAQKQEAAARQRAAAVRAALRHAEACTADDPSARMDVRHCEDVWWSGKGALQRCRGAGGGTGGAEPPAAAAATTGGSAGSGGSASGDLFGFPSAQRSLPLLPHTPPLCRSRVARQAAAAASPGRRSGAVSLGFTTQESGRGASTERCAPQCSPPRLPRRGCRPTSPPTSLDPPPQVLADPRVLCSVVRSAT